MDDAAVERLASTMLEQAVYHLPDKKPAKPATMSYADKVDALRPPDWQGQHAATSGA